jgi:hypothetical protein
MFCNSKKTYFFHYSFLAGPCALHLKDDLQSLRRHIKLNQIITTHIKKIKFYYHPLKKKRE